MLSKREKEVLRLIIAGVSDAEIASHLGIASGTVHSHVRNMLEKTGARNRAQLGALALARGWLRDGVSVL
jgi:DNA-binding NarL/FixJ family response regulator